MERTTSPSLAARGLSPQAVERSRQKHGSNALTKQGRSGFGKQLLSNFGDPIIKILLAALLLNLLFVFKEQNWFESVGIAIAIFLATFVSTLSEYGSESAFLRLQQEAQALRCRVMREGKIALIPLDEVVVGDLVLLESNHDPDMLRHNDHYNERLKQRILGNRGHLSNAACADALLQIVESGTKNVILGHLSGENNTPSLAYHISEDRMTREGIRLGQDLTLDVALRDRVGNIYTLGDGK